MCTLCLWNMYPKIITTLPKATYNEETAHTTTRTGDPLEVGINADGKVSDGLIKWESRVGADAEGGGMWVDRCVCLLRYLLK